MAAELFVVLEIYISWTSSSYSLHPFTWCSVILNATQQLYNVTELQSVRAYAKKSADRVLYRSLEA